MDWYRSETWKAYERPESEVTGNKADDYERREPGTAGMVEGVRYQVYETTDGATSCSWPPSRRSGRTSARPSAGTDLFERWPGSKYADHARGNLELRPSSATSSATKTAGEWIDFGVTANVPIAPVNSPRTIAEDPQFQDRFHWIPTEQLGAEQLPTPLKFIDEELPVPEPRADRRRAHRGRCSATSSAGTTQRIAESRAKAVWRCRPGS